MTLLIKNGRVLDPAPGLDDYVDVLVRWEIRALSKGIEPGAHHGEAGVTVLMQPAF